ncbi:MAG: hypothetical protein WCY74_03725 [Sphaerochaetaceae bacterium]|nr:hypothetical protein [Sphaerochaetaceae bacterium]
MSISRPGRACVCVIIAMMFLGVGCSSITDTILRQQVSSHYPSIPMADTYHVPLEDVRGIDAGWFEPMDREIVPLVETPPYISPVFVPLPDHGSSVSSAQEPDYVLEEKASEELVHDLSAISPYVPSPKESLRSQAIEIAEARYAEAISGLEADMFGEFHRLVRWDVSFDKMMKDSTLAREHSYLVSVVVNHIDRPNFSVALAASVFALDVEDPISIGNLASAILSAGERRHPYAGMEPLLAPYREDARILYAYALACSLAGSSENPSWTLRSLTPLVNLGNLLVDLKELEEAKAVLLAARTLDPTDWPAALALASCYEAQGRRDLAKRILEDERLRVPAMIAARKAAGASLEETDVYVGIPPHAPDAQFEQALTAMRDQDILTAADFIGQLDQSDRNKMRHFIENLPVQGSYQAPPITLVSQFSSLQAINGPLGLAALNDFAEAVNLFGIRASFSEIGMKETTMENLGMSVSYNFDMQDVMAHPEKYEDFEAQVEVEGEEQLEARIAEMERLAMQAERELATGKTASVIALGSMIDPSIALFGLDLNRYADPMNIVMQQYNLAVHNRKVNTYGTYLFSANNRTRQAVDQILAGVTGEFKKIAEREEAASEQLAKQETAARDAGQDTDTAQWRLRWHSLHVTYNNQYNNVANVAWNQATMLAATNYLQKIKPNVEALYYDVIRHVAMISDPDVREQKEKNLRAIIDQNVFQGLVIVLNAFSALNFAEEWDCGCDVKNLREQYDQEQEAIEKAENERIARNRGEKKRFESGEIPESSPLFKKLDDYGTDLDIPFIPFMTGRISCARTVVEFKADLSSIGGPKLDYGFTESAATGATTHRGGMELAFDRDIGSGFNAGATLSVGGSVSMDGKGVVTDYSATGSARISLSAGDSSLSAGGEVSVGPNGVVTYDTSVSATGSVGSAIGGGEVSVESSIQRGSSMTARAEANLNPFSDGLDTALNSDADGNSSPLQVDTSMKQELWNGRFTQ